MKKIIYKVQMFYNGQKVAPVKAIDLFDACLISMSNFYTFNVKKGQKFESYILLGQDVVFSIHKEDTPEQVLLNFLVFAQKSLQED